MSSSSSHSKPSRASAGKNGKQRAKTTAKKIPHKKINDEHTALKGLWERLRQKNVPADERSELAEELFAAANGKMYEVGVKHDTSRIVQSLLQFSTEGRRDEIVSELQGSLLEMSKLQYSHFIVLKALRYATSNRSQTAIFRALRTHVVRVGTHQFGAKVIDSALERLPRALGQALRCEFFGREFALFATERTADAEQQPALSVHAILEERPDKRERIVENLSSLIQRLADKRLLHLSFTHELLWDFLQIADPSSSESVVATVSDVCLELLATRAGSKAVAHCAAFGSAKDRKRIMKALKGRVAECLMHQHAYLAVLRVIDVTDDTVSVQKTLLAEITDSETLVSIMNNRNGGKLFLHLLCPANTAFFDPSELNVLKPATTVDASTGESVSTSKKSPEQRRQELLRHLRTPLEQVCIAHAPQLLCSREGSRVLVEVASSWRSADVIQAIAEAARDGNAADDSAESRVAMFDHAVAHVALKSMCSIGGPFADCVLQAVSGLLGDWVSSNRGAFVLSALLKAASPTAAETARAELVGHKAAVRREAKTKQGAAILLKQL